MKNEYFKYMKEAIASDIVELLIKEYNLSLTEALENLYESETYSKISDPAIGLYSQGSLYVYSYLQNELQSGVMC